MVSHRMLVKHSNGANHKQALASWCEYVRNSKRGMSIKVLCLICQNGESKTTVTT